MGLRVPLKRNWLGKQPVLSTISAGITIGELWHIEKEVFGLPDYSACLAN